MVIKITHKQTMYFSKTIHRTIIKIPYMDHKGIPKLILISSKIILLLPLPIYFKRKPKILICGLNQHKILQVYLLIQLMYFNKIHISKHLTNLIHNKIYSNNLNNNNKIYSNNHHKPKIHFPNHNNK